VSGDDPADPPRGALQLIHHHPGRLRVRAEAFQAGDAAGRARAALEVEPGITRVTHNPRTGSLLVEYQAGLADPEAVLRRIAAAAGLDVPSDEDRARRREPAVVAIDAAREINELVHEVTGYNADLRTLVPAGMAVLAGYSLLAHEDARLPRWDNLLYWSYNIFTQLHRREIDAAAAAPAPRRDAPASEEHPATEAVPSAPRAKPAS
jgi:hypothetical protein